MGPTAPPSCARMRLMFVIWVGLIVAGVVFFIGRALAPLMRKFLREQSLSLSSWRSSSALVGQAIAGWQLHNDEAASHGEDGISLLRYVTGSDFAVMENWQSEYLQFLLFMLATVWLLVTESKQLTKVGRESAREEDRPPRRQRLTTVGARRWLAGRHLRESLLIAMAIIFGSWFAQSVTGWTDFNADQADHSGDRVSWWIYVGSPSFWKAHSRTGSPSSSRSAPSRSSPSICASAGHPNRSRSASHTRRRV